MAHITVNVMPDDNSRWEARSHGGHFWLKFNEDVSIFIDDENQLGELMGAIDQLVSLMAERDRISGIV